MARATEKLRELKPEEINKENVKKILEDVTLAFDEEFDKLAEPVRKAMLESYDEGLKETGAILSELNEGGK